LLVLDGLKGLEQVYYMESKMSSESAWEGVPHPPGPEIRNAPDIPISEDRGFTARFDKSQDSAGEIGRANWVGKQSENTDFQQGTARRILGFTGSHSQKSERFFLNVGDYATFFAHVATSHIRQACYGEVSPCTPY
jgi:hypothetical protein